MKPFSSRFLLLGLPLVFATHSTPAFAAPVDRDGILKGASSLPWLGDNSPGTLTAGDEFSRAVALLEKCRNAENEAKRGVARGEMTQRQLQTFRSATEQAQKRVEALLNSTGKARSATAFLVSVPPARATAKTPTPQPALTPTATRPVMPAPLAPRVTVLGHRAEGNMSSPPSISHPPLHRLQKAGTRPKIRFIAMLPQGSFTSRNANPIASGPTVSATAPKAVAALATPMPVASSPVATLPTNKTTPKTLDKSAAKSAAPSAQAASDLQRLAQLDAALQRADKRLSAANEALTEGQQQLTRFAGTLRQAMMEAGPDAVGLHPFVKIAEKYAGTPYVWGGESRSGFDCSGMIIRVMRDLGYKALPHSAAEQFHYGKPIAQQLLKPGDLVFFANTYKAGISHVGIYLGKRRFIHAAGTGKGTIVSSLDTAKFQEKYAGARRLISSRGD